MRVASSKLASSKSRRISVGRTLSSSIAVSPYALKTCVIAWRSIGVQVKAVHAGGRLKQLCGSSLAGALLVERLRLQRARHRRPARRDAGWPRSSWGRAQVREPARRAQRHRCRAAGPWLRLNQRGDRMAARHTGCQPVVGVGGVERRGPLKVLHGLFKLAIQEQFAR